MPPSSATACKSVGPSLFRGPNSAQEVGVDVPDGHAGIAEAQKSA